ncbi:GumC family protein [Bacteroides sp. UBA939]|uniref:GumC family protein n=1 Tax=Bacteroides sp. UBA939 TaxID=1946092 RepID=UPI0025B7E1D3|nr:GNVR domain-containing protein [Bacteroides sp. UBA939]
MNDENIHIGTLLKQFFGYWKIYIPIGFVCLIGAILFVLVTPRKYEFTARMQLVNDNQGMMSELKMLKNSGIGALLGGSNSGISVEDEVIVLMSRTNITEAILQTGYQVEVRQRRGLKNVLLYGKDSPISFLFPEQFLDTVSEPVKMKLTLSDGKIQSAKIESKLFETVKLQEQLLPFRMSLPVGAIMIVPNKDMAITGEQTITCQITPLQKVYEDLYEDVYAGAQETVSDIILLSFDNEHKQRGCDFLNTLMAAFNQYSRNVKVKETNQNANFVKERLDSVTAELVYLEHEIETYKKQNNIPEPALYANAAISGQRELESAILGTEARLKMLDYVLEYMKNPENEYASVPIIEGVGDKAITLYNQLVLDRQRLLLSSEKGNPALTLADTQLTEQRKMLMEAIDAARRSIRVSLEEIKKKNDTFGNRLNALPTQEREYIEMKRRQKIKETIYLFLMQKLQEKELVNSPDEQAGRVVDAAYSSAKAVYPRKAVVLSIAFVIACIISLIAISLRVFIFTKK